MDWQIPQTTLNDILGSISSKLNIPDDRALDLFHKYLTIIEPTELGVVDGNQLKNDFLDWIVSSQQIPRLLD